MDVASYEKMRTGPSRFMEVHQAFEDLYVVNEI